MTSSTVRCGTDTIEFLAQRVGELRGRRILRVRLPALGGKFALLASTAHYRDESSAFGDASSLPATSEDLDAALAA